MSAIPADIRARITALFPPAPPSPVRVRAATLATSIHERGVTTASLLAHVDAADSTLGEYARWIVATGDRDPAPSDRATAEREIRDTMAALRVLSYRRESGLLEAYIEEHPNDERARRRVLDLTVAVREIERRFPGAAQRAALELARDAGAPVRRAPNEQEI